jgi:hypothetical protein
MVHRASGFKQAPIAKMEAIQSRFAIDADGVFQDEHIGECIDRGQTEDVDRSRARVAGSGESGAVR